MAQSCQISDSFYIKGGRYLVNMDPSATTTYTVAHAIDTLGFGRFQVTKPLTCPPFNRLNSSIFLKVGGIYWPLLIIIHIYVTSFSSISYLSNSDYSLAIRPCSWYTPMFGLHQDSRASKYTTQTLSIKTLNQFCEGGCTFLLQS